MGWYYMIKLINSKNEILLDNLLLLCKKYKSKINIKNLKNIALTTIKYLSSSKFKRKNLYYNQELETLWYKKIEKNIIDYSIYDDDRYISELWACFIVYSKKYLKSLLNIKSFPPNGFLSEFKNVKTILDMGCGFGLTTGILKEIFPKMIVYGTNIKDTLQYSVAKYFSKTYDFKILTDINNLKEIDLIFASEYFEHLENPIDELSFILKKLKPKYLLIANSFGTRGIGHFNIYNYNGNKYTGKEISKIFIDKLKENNYEKVKTKLWNNRPAYYRLKNLQIKEILHVDK